jgi:hypothetical protein
MSHLFGRKANTKHILIYKNEKKLQNKRILLENIRQERKIPLNTEEVTKLRASIDGKPCKHFKSAKRLLKW